MSVLSMMEAKLPPGFRFHPRDDELICEYLENKIYGANNESYHSCLMMIDVDLNKCEPWDLPEMACVGGKEWYFFSLRDRKYATGHRTNRATDSGYWKATGKDRPVIRKGALVGTRKTLVFYQGRAPKGKKTYWVMHEFRMETDIKDSTKISTKEDWALCRVFCKSKGKSPTLTATTTFSPIHSYDDNASSSLPPLMDTYFTFDHTAANHNQSPPMQPSCQVVADVGACLMNPNCNRQMIKAVLSHLAMMEGSQKNEASMSLGDGAVQSYLSTEAGLQNMW